MYLSSNKHILYVYSFSSLLHLFVIAVLTVSSIIHQWSEYINSIVTVHPFTSASSAYAVENTEAVKVQSDVYRR